MDQGVLATLIIVGLFALLVVVAAIPVIAGLRGGRRLLKRVKRERPDSVAFMVEAIPAPQPDLDRLTDGRVLTGRMVISAEDTGLELWTRDSDEPVMQLSWSSVESTGRGDYYTPQKSTWYRTYGPQGGTIAFNLVGGGSIHFGAPREPLPLDVLEQLESTREGRRELER